MNINRLNYENYFLLYVDGELSAAEMQAVESFAAENKDLADELDLLLQTRLTDPEELIFENKSGLYRTTDTSINGINYEEKFLLFVDQELSADEQQETMTFLAKHPQYLGAFESIQQTRLPEESIPFPFKDSLYRKETESKPLVWMQWRRIAIAAALIGVIALIGILLPSTDRSGKMVKTKSLTAPLSPTVPKQNGMDQAEDKAPVFVSDKQQPVKKSIIQFAAETQLNTAPAIEQELAIAETPKHSAEQETIALNNNHRIAAPNNHTMGIETDTHAQQISAVNNRVLASEENNLFKPAVYKELDTDDERKSLFVGAVEINKDKLRGFLRKASSLFKGKNKSEEEKTEISNTHTLE